MRKSATGLSHGSSESSKKGSMSLVLSLADQRLTLEYDEDLDQFENGTFIAHTPLRTIS